MGFFISSRSNILFTAVITTVLSLFLFPTSSQAADGDLKWVFDADGSNNYWSSPVIGADGTIYIGSGSGGHYSRLDAINPDGTLKWSLDERDFLDWFPPALS